MIKLQVGCITQTVKQFTFPAGEVGVRLMECGEAEQVTVKAYIKNSNDLIALLMVSDAIDRRFGNPEKTLHLNYVPYARQDRVCNEGESLSVAVLANLINSCDWSKVKIVDPHSDVTSALIKNCQVTESYTLLKKDLSNYYIVAPDAGAYKKAYKWAEKKRAKGVITANKVRDVRTGEIKGLRVLEDTRALNLLVVDDILDGGRTFTELAKVIEKPNKLELFVTHGIFSKGVNDLTNCYDKIYTTNSFHGEIPEELKHDKINWIMI